MKRTDFERACDEAKEFLIRAKKLELASDKGADSMEYGPLASSLKRQSMELTRALVRIRHFQGSDA